MTRAQRRKRRTFTASKPPPHGREEQTHRSLFGYLLHISLAHHWWTRFSHLPISRRKLRAEFIAALPTDKPVILMVSHDSGYGTERHVGELAEFYRSDVRSLLLTVKHDGSTLLSFLEPRRDIAIKFDPSSEIEELIAHLRDCKIERLHIHHPLRSEHFLQRLVTELGCPFDFTIHDYYVLSPQPHLTGDDDRFVGEDLFAAEAELLRHSFIREPVASLQGWQKAHEWLVLEADRVIAPSEDVARRYKTYLPQARVIVTPHLDLPIPHGPFTPRLLTAEGTLRVALLGRLAPHKGYHVVLETAKLARSRQLPLEFILIGFSDEDRSLDEALVEAGVSVSEKYRDSELPTLLETSQPHVVWFAAQCPETYSYTLTTSLRSNLCLVVPSLGAFPERVAGRPWTWVQRWDCNEEDWIKLFLSIREQLLATGPGHEIAASDFYRREYLVCREKRGSSD